LKNKDKVSLTELYDSIQKTYCIEKWEQYLQSWITKKDLEKVYLSKSPLQAAKEKKKARDELMKIVIPKISSNMSLT
jgi:hypothetical protein